MIGRYCGGTVPSAEISEERRLAAKRAGVEADAMALASALELARDQFILNFDDYSFNRALEIAWSIIARVDKLITESKPWELVKHEEQHQTLNAVLYRAAETLRWLAVLLHPVMPDATRAIWQQLGQKDELSKADPAQLRWGGLREGTSIGEITPIFPRIDKVKTMAQIEKETAPAGAHATEADAVPGAATSSATKPEPPMRGATEADAVPSTQAEAAQGIVNLINIEDFAKVDLRVGQILTAERLPKSDKLLRFTVDLGEATPRQILAGIAQYYEPEKLIGRKIIVVANLQPRKLRGHESQGMVLAASVGEEGRPVLATFTEDVPNGARLK